MALRPDWRPLGTSRPLACRERLRPRTGQWAAVSTFPVTVAPSTLTHHFRVLRQAGVIRQREDGNRRWTTLRHADLQARFPGLLDAILQTEAPTAASPGDHGRTGVLGNTPAEVRSPQIAHRSRIPGSDSCGPNRRR